MGLEGRNGSVGERVCVASAVVVALGWCGRPQTEKEKAPAGGAFS
jgi:hypothetical protein